MSVRSCPASGLEKFASARWYIIRVGTEEHVDWRPLRHLQAFTEVKSGYETSSVPEKAVAQEMNL